MGGVPKALAYESNGIGKGRMLLAIPGGLGDRKCSSLGETMSQQGDDGKQAEQYRRGAGNGEARPLALCFHPQMGPDLLKGDLHLPAGKEPLEDLGGVLIELGKFRRQSWHQTIYGVSVSSYLPF
jgi:hypothetical protein